MRAVGGSHTGGADPARAAIMPHTCLAAHFPPRLGEREYPEGPDTVEGPRAACSEVSAFAPGETHPPHPHHECNAGLDESEY
jgi:hypothetical protein